MIPTQPKPVRWWEKPAKTEQRNPVVTIFSVCRSFTYAMFPIPGWNISHPWSSIISFFKGRWDFNLNDLKIKVELECKTFNSHNNISCVFTSNVFRVHKNWHPLNKCFQIGKLLIASLPVGFCLLKVFCSRYLYSEVKNGGISKVTSPVRVTIRLH